MIGIQRAAIVALDPSARKVSCEIAARLADYRLTDGLAFPDNLWQEIWVTNTPGTPPKQSSAKSQDAQKATRKLSLADLSLGRDGFSDAFCLGVLNTVQLDADQYLRTSRALNPRPQVSFYLVGSLWEPDFQPAIMRVLDAIHSRPEGRGGSDVFLTLLLPELCQTETGGAEEAQLRRARTFAALREIESLVQDTVDTPWEDWFPVNHLWVCGAQDYHGRGLGNLDAVSKLLGEGTATLIAENVLGQQSGSEGTDARQERDILGNSRCYGSIGFAQLSFPREALREKLFDRVRTRVYEEYILRNAELAPDELVITARSFLTNDVALHTVADRLKQTQSGDMIVPDFAFADVGNSSTDHFLQRLDAAVEEYRERPLADAKLALMERADGIASDLTEGTQDLFQQWIDNPGYGPVQTSALAGEILGESRLFTREERRPIGHFMSAYRAELSGLLGAQRAAALERSPIADTLGPSEGQVPGSDVSGAIANLDPSAFEDGQVGEGGTPSTAEDVEVDERRRCFEEIDRLGQMIVVRTSAVLRDLDEAKTDARRQIDNLNYRVGSITRRLLLWQPLLALLGYGMSALGWQLANDYLGISEFFRIVFGHGHWRLHILGVGAYIAYAALDYLRLVWLPRGRLRRQEMDLKAQEAAQRELVVKHWRTYFGIHMKARIYDHAIALLQKVGQNVGSLRLRIEAFIGTARGAIQPAAGEERPSVPATREVISTTEDVEYFEGICFDRPIPEEVEPVFLPEKGGSRLSDLVWRGGDCVADLEKGIRAFFDERFDSRLGRLSIEELLMEHWTRIHPPVSPQRRASEVFALSPFVQLEGLPGEPKVGQNYTVGIYQGEQSRFFDFLGEAPPFPFAVFPCSSRERIIIFCQTTSFSVAAIAKLRSYRQAFDKLSKGKALVVHYPEEIAGRKYPTLIPSG